MSIHTKCLVEACKKLNVEYSFVGGDDNFLRINCGNKRYYFPGPSTPFNDGATSKICRDKEMSYKLLKEVITMPKSMGFVDPEGPEIYRGYSRVESKEEILGIIEKEFEMPVIVKRNSGSQGRRVFLCANKKEISEAINKVFEKDEKEPQEYDHVLLAQEYIKAEKEYRAVVFEEDVLLLYEKNISEATFTGNLSPLHWQNSKAIRVTDESKIEKIREFAKPIYSLLDLRYGGLDIMENADGKLTLIELNSRPGFGRFAEDNGAAPLIEMYCKIVKNLIAPSDPSAT